MSCKQLITCKKCKGWFHSECVGVTAAEKYIQPYFCSNCDKKSETTSSFAPNIAVRTGNTDKAMPSQNFDSNVIKTLNLSTALPKAKKPTTSLKEVIPANTNYIKESKASTITNTPAVGKASGNTIDLSRLKNVLSNKSAFDEFMNNSTPKAKKPKITVMEVIPTNVNPTKELTATISAKTVDVKVSGTGNTLDWGRLKKEYSFKSAMDGFIQVKELNTTTNTVTIGQDSRNMKAKKPKMAEMELIEKNANPVEELNTTTSSSIVMKPKKSDKKSSENKKSKLHQEYTDTKDNNQQTSEDLEQDILGKQVREELTVHVSSVHEGKKPYKSVSIGMKPKRSNKKSSDTAIIGQVSRNMKAKKPKMALMEVIEKNSNPVEELNTITSDVGKANSGIRNILDQGGPKNVSKCKTSEIDDFMNTYAKATTYAFNLLQRPRLSNVPHSPLPRTLIGCGYCGEIIEMNISKKHFQMCLEASKKINGLQCLVCKIQYSLHLDLVNHVKLQHLDSLDSPLIRVSHRSEKSLQKNIQDRSERQNKIKVKQNWKVPNDLTEINPKDDVICERNRTEKVAKESLTSIQQSENIKVPILTSFQQSESLTTPLMTSIQQSKSRYPLLTSIIEQSKSLTKPNLTPIQQSKSLTMPDLASIIEQSKSLTMPNLTPIQQSEPMTVPILTPILPPKTMPKFFCQPPSFRPHLDNHVLAVKKAKIFYCTICKEEFAKIEELKDHFSSVHEGKKPSQLSNSNTEVMMKRSDQVLKPMTNDRAHSKDFLGKNIQKNPSKPSMITANQSFSDIEKTSTGSKELENSKSSQFEGKVTKYKIKPAKVKCEYCKQLFKGKHITKHYKNGKCKLYSKFIVYNSNGGQCNLCCKFTTSERKDMCHLYKHIEKKHRIETLKIETNELLEKVQDSLEVKIISQKRAPFDKTAKKKAIAKIWLDIEKNKESKCSDKVKSKKRKKCENCNIEFLESILANHNKYCRIDSKEAINKKSSTTVIPSQTINEGTFKKNHSNKASQYKDTLNLNNHKNSTTKSCKDLDENKPCKENVSKKAIQAFNDIPTVGLIKCEYCREKVEKNKVNKHNSECLKAAKKISVDNQCLICSTKFTNKFEVFQHVKLDHSDIFLGPKVINSDGLDNSIEVKKEPLIKETMSQSIEPTSSFRMGIQEGYKGLSSKSNKQTSHEIVNIDDSEDEIEVNMGSDPNPRSNKQTNIEQTFPGIKINKPTLQQPYTNNKPTAGLHMGLPGSQNGLNPRSNKATNFEANFQENLIEPTPLIVEFYSCPASDKLSPCPNYNSEEKVRQHIAFFHKINFEAQMLCGLKIKKTIL